MPRAALKTRDDSAHSDKIAEASARKTRAAAREQKGKKPFESLTDGEKDALLKELAVRAGLIDDTDDA